MRVSCSFDTCNVNTCCLPASTWVLKHPWCEGSRPPPHYASQPISMERQNAFLDFSSGRYAEGSPSGANNAPVRNEPELGSRVRRTTRRRRAASTRSRRVEISLSGERTRPTRFANGKAWRLSGQQGAPSPLHQVPDKRRFLDLSRHIRGRIVIIEGRDAQTQCPDPRGNATRQVGERPGPGPSPGSGGLENDQELVGRGTNDGTDANFEVQVPLSPVRWDESQFLGISDWNVVCGEHNEEKSADSMPPTPDSWEPWMREVILGSPDLRCDEDLLHTSS